MYKGKFDQKNKQEVTDIQELLAQRNSAPAKEPPAERPKKAAPQNAAPVKKEAPVRDTSAKAPGKAPSAKTSPAKTPSARTVPPARTTAQPARTQPAKKPAAQPAKPHNGPRLGGVIFYTLYFMFILVFFVATFIGLLWLRGWLTDYELAQPTAKAEQVFTQLFTDPDWDALYDASGVQDSAYEGKEQFVTYMTNKIGNSQLTYLATSAGLSTDKKYVVRLGNEKVAAFTLVDKNNVGDTTLDNLGKLPDWQLGTVEVFFERDSSYLIEKVNGHTALVNDVILDDSNIIQIATTKAEEYLPDGTTGVSMCVQEVTGLFTQPTVTIFDEKGNQMEVTYDETTHTFTERTESNTITDELKEQALNAARNYCMWMIEALKDRATFAKYFDPSSEIYKTTVALSHSDLFMQSNNGYEFVNETVSNYCRYTDDLFSVRVAITMNVTRTDNSVKPYEYEKSMFFRKNDSGKWLCFEATNVDVSQPVGRVRLTFMYGDTVLTSDMYQTDSSEIITPLISPIPEGKVLTGWATVSEDESGSTVYTLVFQPDSTGRVAIPEGTSLEPMTLYALFEDAGAASTAAAESPEPTEGA